jgi:SAM-dependent methyltransferase
MPAFDAAYATESLEHAVEMERAVAEICRVVKPGGRIVIIDKNRDQWGRLPTPEWERWFGRRELERLLGRYCRPSPAASSPTGKMCRPTGLFWPGWPSSDAKARPRRLRERELQPLSRALPDAA